MLRLSSWKEIASYLGVSVRTAQRWESSEKLPVRRHRHTRLGSAYAFASELDAWRLGRSDGTALAGPPSVPSIAVLPVSALDRDQETQILADGLTDELITSLGQVENLRVVARSSSFYFKGRQVDVREAGKRLGVQTILVGSMRRRGGRLRLTAQLVSTADGSHLWTERFDREAPALFELEDELTASIVDSLHARLVVSSAGTPRRPKDEQAYKLFLRGRYFWNQRTRDGLEKALTCYQEVVEREPTFAAAHAGLADCYAFLWVYAGREWAPMVDAAEAAASEALRLDPESSDGHTSLGMARLARFDVTGAYDAFARTLELNPKDTRARHWNAMTETSLGRIDDGIAGIAAALDSDPFAMTPNQDYGRMLFLARRYDEAVVQLEHTLEIAPTARWARIFLGFAHVQLEAFEDALTVLEAHPALRAYVRGRMGHRIEARRELNAQSSNGGTCTWAALLHLCLDEADEAIARLEQANRRHELEFLEMCPKVQPLFDPLQSHPRFESLLPN